MATTVSKAMLILFAAALLLCLSETADGQSDSTRRPPKPAPVIRLIIPDSARTLDVESVEIIKNAAASSIFDRLGPVKRRAMLDSLEAQRRLWAERRPRVYAIRLVVNDGCIFIRTRGARDRTRAREAGPPRRDLLIVRDTTVVRREPAPIPRYVEQYCPREWRIEDLFADVADALSDSNADIRDIRYDEVYGFPRSYWVDRGMHRQWRVIVESFAPAR
jgi:hypothetical protein